MTIKHLKVDLSFKTYCWAIGAGFDFEESPIFLEFWLGPIALTFTLSLPA